MVENAVALVEDFWDRMMTNDFRSVGPVLADDFVLDWPQSNERIRGRDNFTAMNEEYPAHGRWQFTVNKIVGNDLEAVSDVTVTDGVQYARAISFFNCRQDRQDSGILAEPFSPEDRKHWLKDGL
jgi:hypothetical protein